MGISQIPQALVPATFPIPANDSATVSSRETTTSVASYTDLTSLGPSVTLTTGTKALVIFRAMVDQSAASVNPIMDFAISGATTRSASDTTFARLYYAASSIGSGDPRPTIVGFAVVTLTAGSNTFTAKYRCSNAGTSGFQDRTIFVMNLA